MKLKKLMINKYISNKYILEIIRTKILMKKQKIRNNFKNTYLINTITKNIIFSNKQSIILNKILLQMKLIC